MTSGGESKILGFLPPVDEWSETGEIRIAVTDYQTLVEVLQLGAVSFIIGPFVNCIIYSFIHFYTIYY